MVSPLINGFDRRAFLRGAAAGSVALGLSGLAACGTPGAAGGSSGSAGQLSMVGVAEPQAGRGLSKLLTDYANKSGHPKVKYQYFPSEQFVALFTTAVRSNPPSAIMLNGQDTRRYGLNGTLEPLKIDYLDRFYDLGPKTYTINGRLYGVPSGSTGGFMILYNHQLLDKIGAQYPKTYDDLKSVGTELKKIGVDAFTHPGKVIYLWPVWFFTTYAQVTGNKPVERTEELLKGQGKFTDDEIVEALDMIFAFQRDGLFGKDILGLDTTGALANIERGKAAFWLGGDLGGLMNDNPKNVTPGQQVLPMLVDQPGVVSQFPGGPGSPLSIYSKASDKAKQQSLDLINYLSSDASCSYLVKDGQASYPSNKHAAGSKNPAALEGLKYIDRMFVYLDWYWPPEITTAFQKGIQSGLSGGNSAKQVAADIQAVWEGLLKSGYTYK